MAKLTDTQLVILSNAARHGDRSVLPLPPSIKLNQRAIAVVFKSLLRKGLAEARPAKRGETCCYEGDDGKRVTLRVTDSGLKALGIASEPAQGKDKRSAAQEKTADTNENEVVPIKNKRQRILELLGRTQGASILELQSAIAWQAHSVRAAITGLRKTGVAITLFKHENGPTTYHAATKR